VSVCLGSGVHSTVPGNTVTLLFWISQSFSSFVTVIIVVVLVVCTEFWDIWA